MKARTVARLAGAAALIFTFSCRNDSPTRSYVERTGTAAWQAPAATRQHGSPAKVGVWRWASPETWTEEKGTAMRAAAFRITDGAREAECAIIPLEGDAGGVRANVERWLGQLRLRPLAGKELDRFLEDSPQWTSADGWPVQAFDFTTLELAEAGSAPISGMAAMVRAPDEILFIKMTGERTLIVENRERFLALCRSIRRRNE